MWLENIRFWEDASFFKLYLYRLLSKAGHKKYHTRKDRSSGSAAVVAAVWMQPQMIFLSHGTKMPNRIKI